MQIITFATRIAVKRSFHTPKSWKLHESCEIICTPGAPHLQSVLDAETLVTLGQHFLYARGYPSGVTAYLNEQGQARGILAQTAGARVSKRPCHRPLCRVNSCRNERSVGEEYAFGARAVRLVESIAADTRLRHGVGRMLAAGAVTTLGGAALASVLGMITSFNLFSLGPHCVF